jgi:hypothetical protein
MPSDLPGEFGPLDPGLEQYLQLLTGGPDPDELAGEQGALTMFQLNRQPLPNATQPLGGAASAGGWRTDGAARNAARAAVRWRVRLVAAAAVAFVGGVAGAAYASALPAPVQHLAHVALSFAGVPDSHHPANSGKPSANKRPAGAAHRSPAAGSTPSGPTASRTQPPATTSPGAQTALRDVLVAATPDRVIAAGTQATVDGTLTKSGRGVAGTHVNLYERAADQLHWQLVGAAATDNQGNVAMAVPALGTNAVFRLTGPGGVVSQPVRISVTPAVSVALDSGSRGIADVLVVTAQYANRGDVAVLQVQQGGAWQSLRKQTLDASLTAGFGFKAANFENDVLRVVVLATSRHTAAVSNSVTVPAPG